jgi:uridine kinase
VEEIQDVIEKVLIENGHAKTAKAFILYRDKQDILRSGTVPLMTTADSVPWKKIWHVLNFNIDHDCHTVEGLNKWITSGRMPELIAASERAYTLDVANAAREVLKRKDDIRLVIIAGPSSSGKTTTTIKLGEHLKKEGLGLVAMNLDNYFFNLDHHPRDEYGDYDFETPAALDIELINQHLADLLAGKTIQSPIYSFKQGIRLEETIPMSIKSNEIILIDCLHGLYDKMTASVPRKNKFPLYIETLSQLKGEGGDFTRWTDVRLLRRMIRDSWHRSYNPLDTVGHWHYVRKAELRYIVPHLHSVDYIVNGALAYELPFLKYHLFKFFPEILEAFSKDPKKLDAYIRANRVYNLLKTIADVEDDSMVPMRSHLREFIGGSEYSY